MTDTRCPLFSFLFQAFHLFQNTVVILVTHTALYHILQATERIAQLRRTIRDLTAQLTGLASHKASLTSVLRAELDRRRALELMIHAMHSHEDRLSGHVQFARELFDLAREDGTGCPRRLLLLNERHRTDTIQARKAYETALEKARQTVPEIQREIREVLRQEELAGAQLRGMREELGACRSGQKVTRCYEEWEA